MDALINGEFEVERNKGQPNSTIMKATVLRRVEDSSIDIGDKEVKESIFKVEFEDGHNAFYTANQILAEIYASVDSEGYRMSIMKEIVDHDEDIDKSVNKDEMYFTDKDGKSDQRRTTAGWNFKVLCEDGSEQWVPLWELKEACPVKVWFMPRLETCLICQLSPGGFCMCCGKLTISYQKSKPGSIFVKLNTSLELRF